MDQDPGTQQTILKPDGGELKFRRLLEKLPAAAYTCNPEGLITYFNPRAVELWGRAPALHHPRDRFCGSFKLFAADGSPIRHDQCWMAQALLTNREFNGHEILVERPDGTRLTAMAYANPIRDEVGNLLGAMNVLVDITDRKRAEDTVRDADRAKDEFLATLAHELRNPLAPVRYALGLLRLRDHLTPDTQWAVDVIERQMRQMTRLVDDLLDVSRITRNKLELRKAEIDLAEVIQAAVETSRPHFEVGGQQFSVALPAEAIYIDADQTRLAQALGNLLNNAAKYTERGGHIELVVERQGSDAVIRVRDDGIGIATEMLPRVFDLFAQADRSLERTQSGLGIGLTLVKRLIEMHGGSIEAHSAGPGKGSEFAVRLPILVAASARHEGRVARAERSASTGSLRILVVDDNCDSASSLSMLLRMVGNDIRIAHDGLEALQVADEFQPDVALLDIGLPRLNGYDVARKIRERPWGRRAILVALTGWAQDADKKRSHKAGFDHHIVKPVDPAELMSLLGSFQESMA